MVAIHNKNGQGLLPVFNRWGDTKSMASQSTIKMDKGYYSFSRKKSLGPHGRNPQ